LLQFVVCNPRKSSSSLTILVPIRLIIVSVVLFYLDKLLFSDSFNLKVILYVVKIIEHTVTELL